MYVQIRCKKLQLSKKLITDAKRLITFYAEVELYIYLSEAKLDT